MTTDKFIDSQSTKTPTKAEVHIYKFKDRKETTTLEYE